MIYKLVFLCIAITAFCLSAFAQEGGVKGKVRAPNGKGIPNASITIRSEGRDVKSATADSKGEFTITGLASGKYNIVFEAGGYSTGVLHGIEVGKGIQKLGDRLILALDRGTLVIVQGSVFFKEGSSASGAKIELQLINADGSTKDLGSTYSNTSGEFTFRRPEGLAKLRVTAKLKGVVASKNVEVDDAAIYRLAITLPLSAADR